MARVGAPVIAVITAAAIASVLPAGADVSSLSPPAPRPNLATIRASVASDGTQGIGISWAAPRNISGDGRFVTFFSEAPNLAAGDTNFSFDVFVYDRLTEETRRISVAPDGSEANGTSIEPSISSDGRFVTYMSNASNLVAGDTNNFRDVFVYDRVSGETTRASVASDGTQSNASIGFSGNPKVSNTGRYVSFESDASNLVPGDTNGMLDVFVRDRLTNTTTRVSVSSNGTQANGESLAQALSADGRYLTFYSFASNLVPGDTNGLPDIFVYDQRTGLITRASLADDGSESNGASGELSTISADGQHVAFASTATNLTASDVNGAMDVFVRDMRAGTTTLVSANADGVPGNGHSFAPIISDNGRFVAFFSFSINLVDGGFQNTFDAWVKDRLTGRILRVNVASDGTPGNAGTGVSAISANGRYVSFASEATNLVRADTNNTSDVFIRQLF